MKARITIISKLTGVVDIGDFPAQLVKDVLIKNDGSFDGNWGLGDVSRNETYTTESVEVEEVE